MMDDDMATYNDTRGQPRIRASIPSHSDPPRPFFVPFLRFLLQRHEDTNI